MCRRLTLDNVRFQTFGLVARDNPTLTPLIGGFLPIVPRGKGSHETLRWSKADSNSESHPRATPPASTRFVADSALEGDGFEPSVPLWLWGLHVVENVVVRSGRRTRLGVRGFGEGEFEGDSPA
jgi:hypothetical protein